MENGEIRQTVMDITGICRSSEFVKSCNRGGIPSNPNVLCANKLNGYYAVSNNCNKYYYCNMKRAYVFSCSTAYDGWAKQFFCENNNVKTSIMNSPKVNVVRLNSGVYKNQCSNVGWMSDSDNCNLFFKCYRNNGALSQTKFDTSDICRSSVYVKNCNNAIGGTVNTTSPVTATPDRTTITSTTSTTNVDETTNPNTSDPVTDNSGDNQ